MQTELESLLLEISRCAVCQPHLPLGPRPIVAAHANAPVLIIGQAPGIRVHQSGVPWDDPSGERLRQWLGVAPADFYDPAKIALMPMGFCYPGTGSAGDLPPRKECAPLWHQQLFKALGNLKLTLLVGRYAQVYYLGSSNKKTLTATVGAWRDYTPTYLPLPHPSPRNNRWLQKNPSFEQDLVPYLQRRIRQLLGTTASDGASRRQS